MQPQVSVEPISFPATFVYLTRRLHAFFILNFLIFFWTRWMPCCLLAAHPAALAAAAEATFDVIADNDELNLNDLMLYYALSAALSRSVTLSPASTSAASPPPGSPTLAALAEPARARTALPPLFITGTRRRRRSGGEHDGRRRNTFKLLLEHLKSIKHLLML